MKEVFDCVVLGVCPKKEYEYTFILNSEETKADKCYSPLLFNDYCIVNDVRYTNVSYKKEIINEYKTEPNPLNTMLFSFSILIVCVSLLECLLMGLPIKK